MPSFSPDPFSYLRRRALGRIGGGGAVAAVIATYAEFQTAIAPRSNIAWTEDNSNVGGNASGRTTCATASGTMTGSSWNSVFVTSSVSPTTFDRMVQHCFPDQASFNSAVAAGRQVGFTRSLVGAVVGFTGLNRNGFTSSSDASSRSAGSVTFFVYWDPSTGPMKMNPSLGLGPVPWDMLSTTY